MNVLVICEDARHDQHIVIPIVRRMFAEIGKPHAKVRACVDPLLCGISQAMNWEMLEGIFIDNSFVQVFLLIVDRDGDASRLMGLQHLEGKASQIMKSNQTFFAENAWQEIEVWALAGQEDLPWRWQEIRAEIHPKETYFQPYVRQRQIQSEIGQGRKTLGLEAASQYKRVRSLCPEDVASLEGRLREWIEK